ncbi:hypothetical protein Tco_0506832, partial [Tanacetum coccineum]
MASSACSSTQNPPKKASKVTYIDLTSNEASPQPHHATIDTTLALIIPPPIPNMEAIHNAQHVQDSLIPPTSITHIQIPPPFYPTST